MFPATSVAFGEGKFVAVRATNNGVPNAFCYSTDGINWTPTSGTANGNSGYSDIVYLPAQGFWIFNYYSSSGYFSGGWRSYDGINWQDMGAVAPNQCSLSNSECNSNFVKIVHANTKYVLAGSGGYKNFYYSSDGKNWSPVSGWDMRYTYVKGLAAKNSRFLCSYQGSGGNPTGMMWSDNGSTWTECTGEFMYAGESPQTMIYDEIALRWYAFSSGPIFASEDNGKSWFEYVAVGTTPYDNKYMRSPGRVEGKTVLGTNSDGSPQFLNMLNAEQFKTGETVQAGKSIIDLTKMYLDYESDGTVNSLITTPMDPPYTTTATNPSLTLKFPATFPSGNTPDEELGEGTVLTVGVASENVVNRSPGTGFEEASVQPKLSPTIADWFSINLWTGTGGSPDTAQDINSGIDLVNNDGMVWIKVKDQASTDHQLFDTKRGDNKYLVSNVAQKEYETTGKCVFTSDGYRVGGQYTNNTGKSIVGWSFRAAPKFFDVVKYDGTGVAGSVPHQLQSEPGMMIVKKTNDDRNWIVYHSAIGNEKILNLNENGPKSGNTQTVWNATTPTSSVFSVGTSDSVNGSGDEYIAYLFADTPGLIKCGGESSNGGDQSISLSFKPQWVLIKTASVADDWFIFDSKFQDPGQTSLSPNKSISETFTSGRTRLSFNDTGFTIDNVNLGWSNGDEFIYVAIAAPVIETLSAEAFAEQKLKFATYQNRKEVIEGQAAMSRRDDLMQELKEAGVSQEQIDKLMS